MFSAIEYSYNTHVCKSQTVHHHQKCPALPKSMIIIIDCSCCITILRHDLCINANEFPLHASAIYANIHEHTEVHTIYSHYCLSMDFYK